MVGERDRVALRQPSGSRSHGAPGKDRYLLGGSERVVGVLGSPKLVRHGGTGRWRRERRNIRGVFRARARRWHDTCDTRSRAAMPHGAGRAAGGCRCLGLAKAGSKRMCARGMCSCGLVWAWRCEWARVYLRAAGIGGRPPLLLESRHMTSAAPANTEEAHVSTRNASGERRVGRHTFRGC